MSTHTVDGEKYTIRRKDMTPHLYCYVVEHVKDRPVSYYAWPPRIADAITEYVWLASVEGYSQPLLLDPRMVLVRKLDQALVQHINDEEQ